jgi:hypothetical protein
MTIMKKLQNCEMKPAHITMRLIGGITQFTIYGYALTSVDDDGNEYIELQPADCRCSPAMRVPKQNVASLIASF